MKILSFIRKLKAFVFFNKNTFYEAVERDDFEVILFLIEIKLVNPSDDYNYAIREASCNGTLKTVDLLLKDTRVDPTEIENYCIRYAYDNNKHSIVELLWNDLRVKTSLRFDNPKLYNLLTINEATNKLKNKLYNF
jgi:hypothetical protein